MPRHERNPITASSGYRKISITWKAPELATASERNWNNSRFESARPQKLKVTPKYIERSLHRLAVIADVPLTRSKQAVCKLIHQWGYYLPDQQREALERWCGG